MNEMMLCSLIINLMDEYSEETFENGELNFSFDHHDYHYECTMKRTLTDGGEDEKTNN